MSSATRDTSVNCWDSRTCRNSTLKKLSWTAETSASSPTSAAVAIKVTLDLMLSGFTPELPGPLPIHPRSLNRCIFPVAVFGNSGRNTIQRGYL